MQPTHPMYPVSRPLLATLHAVAHHPRALRTAHGLVHAMTRQHDAQPGGLSAASGQLYWLPAAELRSRIGLARARDNAALEDGLAALWRAGVVEDYELRNRGQDLLWQVPDELLDRMAAIEVYGLHDVRAIGELKHPLPITWHSETRMVRKMRTPRFELDVDFLGRVHHREASAVPSGPLMAHPWERISGPVVGAARAVADREGLSFVIVARRTPDRLGASTLVVHVLHGATRWRPSALVKAAGGRDRVTLVSATRVERLAPGAFDIDAARRACAVQGKADEPAAAA